MTIPAAIREFDGPTAYEIWNVNHGDPRILGRCIVRASDGTYQTQANMESPRGPRDSAMVFATYGTAYGGTIAGNTVEFLPPEITVIPPATSEMTEGEALNLREPDPRVMGRCLYRDPNGGGWLIGRGERTGDRNQATVYNHYNSSPLVMPEDMIVEFLPDETEAFSAVRIPAAVEEVSGREMNEQFVSTYNDITAELPLRLRSPLIIRMPNGRWRSSYNVGETTADRNMAMVFSRYGCSNGDTSSNRTFEILPADYMTNSTQAESATKPKHIKRLFADDFIKMFEAAPKNDFVRGWILKATKQMPPEDIDSTDKLESWLESIQPKKADGSPAPVPKPGVSVQVTFEGHETGRASYIVPTRGVDEYEFTYDELREMVQSVLNDDCTFEELLDQANADIGDNLGDRTDPSMEWDGHAEHSEHEATGGETDEHQVNQSQLRTRMEDWIRNNMSEAIEPLGL